MRPFLPSTRLLAAGLALTGLLTLPREATAHCDSMDGPVVQAARRALDTNTVEIALAWVLPSGEAEIRAAFDRTMRVRRAGGEALDLAELWFFETLVRIHRTGEGEPYTGLKPAGTEIPRGIVRADQALEAGTVDDLATHLSAQAEQLLRRRFDRVIELGRHDAIDVEAGRRWVRAYTEYMHFVETMYALLDGHGDAHWSAHDVEGEPTR